MLSEVAHPHEVKAQDKSVRVAHILSGAHIWGVENYVYNLLTTEAATKVKSLIICTSSGVISKKFLDAGFEVVIVPIHKYFSPSAVRELIALLKRKNINLLHVHLGLDSFVGAIAGAVSQIPVIMSVHFDHPNWTSAGALKRMTWGAIQKVKSNYIAHFLPITENVAAELMKRESVPADRLTVVYPGIPLFKRDENTRTKIRESLGCSNEDIVVIGVGRLEKEKNFSCLVSAIAQISPTLPIKFWIVGDGAEHEALSQQIAALNIGNRVSMLGYRRDIPDLLSAADIFVLASKKEPFGMSAVEAMIAELPVVATRGPGLSTIVEDGSTGTLVAPDSAEELSQALTELASNSQRRNQFAKAGRARAEKFFTSDEMARKIFEIYEKLAKQ